MTKIALSFVFAFASFTGPTIHQGLAKKKKCPDLYCHVSQLRGAARYYHYHAEKNVARTGRALPQTLKLNWKFRKIQREAFYWRRIARVWRHLPTVVSWQYAVASDYGVGDGFLGSGVACPGGGVLDWRRPIIATLTLPCGRRITVCYNGRCTEAISLDRGPYVAGRSMDLGPLVALRLHFSGVGTVRWR